MHFKEMDPELVLKAIEGYENELEPAKKVQDAFYRQIRCVRCGSGHLEKHFLGVGHSFNAEAGELLPRHGMRCTVCKCVFDPHSGLVVETGSR